MVGVIIGLTTLVVLVIVFILVSSGSNKSDGVIESSDKKVSACNQASGEQVMIMKDDIYEPKDLQIKLCAKVVFKNRASESRWPASNIHPTHGIYPEFDPQEPVEIDQEWSFIFDRAGSWRYHDHLKPSITGTIVVSQ